MADAVCRAADPDMFFPADGAPSGPARAVCGICPVAVPCRDYAVAGSIEQGIWGGTTGAERRRLALDAGQAWTPWASWSPSGLGLFASSAPEAVARRASRARERQTA